MLSVLSSAKKCRYEVQQLGNFLFAFFLPSKCNLTNRGTPFLDKHDDDDIDPSPLLV